MQLIANDRPDTRCRLLARVIHAADGTIVESVYRYDNPTQERRISRERLTTAVGRITPKIVQTWQSPSGIRFATAHKIGHAPTITIAGENQ